VLGGPDDAGRVNPIERFPKLSIASANRDEKNRHRKIGSARKLSWLAPSGNFRNWIKASLAFRD
jgi:hypothetical protein